MSLKAPRRYSCVEYAHKGVLLHDQLRKRKERERDSEGNITTRRFGGINICSYATSNSQWYLSTLLDSDSIH